MFLRKFAKKKKRVFVQSFSGFKFGFVGEPKTQILSPKKMNEYTTLLAAIRKMSEQHLKQIRENFKQHIWKEMLLARRNYKVQVARLISTRWFRMPTPRRAEMAQHGFPNKSKSLAGGVSQSEQHIFIFDTRGHYWKTPASHKQANRYHLRRRDSPIPMQSNLDLSCKQPKQGKQLHRNQGTVSHWQTTRGVRTQYT